MALIEVSGSYRVTCDECGIGFTSGANRILTLTERLGQHTRGHNKKYGWFQMQSSTTIDLNWCRLPTFTTLHRAKYRPRVQQPPLQWGMRAMMKVSDESQLEVFCVTDARRGLLGPT